MGWIITIILGGIAGWIAEKIMKANHGLLMNIVLGIVGAMVANFVLSVLLGAYEPSNWIAYLVVAVGGACALIAAGRAIRS